MVIAVILVTNLFFGVELFFQGPFKSYIFITTNIGGKTEEKLLAQLK
jgi:hypothetical protein